MVELNGAGVRVVEGDGAGVRVPEKKHGMRSHLSGWEAWSEGAT